MDKLTSNSAILRSEVKTQTEFDLLVAVCRANGLPLKNQKGINFDAYKGKYLTLEIPASCLQIKYYLVAEDELISFEDAVFSLAEPEWTHIWQGKLSEDFYYGDSEKIYFDISQIETVPGALVGKYGSLIATREPQVVEPPNPTFKVGDYVERINTYFEGVSVGAIGIVSRSDQTYSLSLEGHSAGFCKKNFKLAVAPKKPKFAVGDVIRRNEGDIDHEVLFMDDRSMLLQALLSPMRFVIHDPCFEDFTRVIPIREQIITVLDDQDYCSAEHADRLLKLFNITGKS